MADAADSGTSAPSGVYEVGVRSGFANVSVRVWCDMDARDGLGIGQSCREICNPGMQSQLRGNFILRKWNNTEEREPLGIGC